MRDLPELPTIKDLTVGTLRLEGTLAKRLPSMPSGDLNDLYFTDVRRMEAEKYANDIKEAFNISRQEMSKNKMRVKARSRATQRQAERR